MRIRCPNPSCGKAYQAAESALGRNTVCKHCGREFTVTRPESEAAPAIPKQLGRFEILGRIGAGAFGTVYRARDPVLDREVALKVPRAAVLESPEARARFLREPKAAAQLRHPHIVPVYDAGSDGEHYYIASAFIEGRTLEELIAESRPDFRRAARIAADLATGLDYAHRAGVVHRDVKPSNVMIDKQGQVLLMDFGLARIEGSEEKLTQDGSLMGTPAYMAPEQADGTLGQVGPASDQYGLGVVLYELLCGQSPFSGPPAVLVFNAIHQDPPSPRSVEPAVPQDLETICLKALAKRPQDRYTDCSQMCDDLGRWLADRPIRARRSGPVERAARWCRRNRALAALSAALVVLLVTVAVLMTSRDDSQSASWNTEDIPRFYEFINDAWARNDLASIAGRVSEDGAVMVLGGPQGFRTVDASGFRKFVQQTNLKKSDLVSHVVRPVRVATHQGFALVRTETEERFADGRTEVVGAVQVLRRYDSGWRIVVHTPDIVDFVVEITEVMPDSQAEQAGMHVGDRVLSYADEPVAMPDQLVHLTSVRVAEQNLPLTITRGSEELSFTVDGGQLGVRLAGYFVPTEGSATSGPEVEAVVELFHDLMAAVREKGWSAQRESLSPLAVVIAPGLDEVTVLSGEALMQQIDEEGPNIDLESARVSDIRVVQTGPVAFAEATVSVRLQDGQEISTPYTRILFNDSGAWQLIAMFPRYFAIHPSVPVHSPATPPKPQ